MSKVSKNVLIDTKMSAEERIYCRLCALLQPESDICKVQLNEQIGLCFKIIINPEDVLPQTVCNNCCYRVLSIYDYYQQVQHAQEILTAIFTNKNNDIKKEEEPEEVQVKIEKTNDDASEHNYQDYLETEELNLDNKLEIIPTAEPPVKKKRRKNVKSDIFNNFKWSCNECESVLESKVSLCDHYKHIHDKICQYKCTVDDCNKIFSNFESFRGHVRRHRNEFAFRCEICERFFNRSCSLKRHIKEVHEKRKPKSVFFCTLCGKSFQAKNYFRRHKQVVHGNSRLECDICNKIFISHGGLAKHKLIHIGDKKYTCELCGTSFVNAANLQSHMSYRHSEKTVKCPDCNQMFKNGKDQRRHQRRIHLQVKDYECEFCGKKYFLSHVLKVHMRMHTGELPFECEFCQKRFRLKKFLTVHIRQHTGERPYSCVECKHDFTDFANYHKHMVGKHGKKTSKKMAKTRDNIEETIV